MILKSPLRKISDTKITLITQLMGGLIASISLIAGARFCGAAAIGQFALLTICLGILADIVDFGRCSWVSREVAAGRTSLREARLVLYFRTKILIFIVAIFAIIIILFLKKYGDYLVFLLYPVFFLQTNYIQQLLFAKDRVKFASLLQILEKTAWLVIFPLEKYVSSRLLLLILPIVLGGILHVGFGILFLIKNDDSDAFFARSTSTKVYFGIQSLVTDLGMLDTVLVGLLSSMSSAGIYNLGAKVRAPFLLLFNSLVFNLRKSFAEHNLEKVRNIVGREKLLIILFYSCIPVASFVLFTRATDIFGDNFIDLNRCLGISVLSVIPQSLLLLCANFLISAGEEKFVSVFSAIFTLANLFILSIGLSIFDLTALDVSLYFMFATCLGTFFLLRKAVYCWNHMS